jgi:hypothetical protein
VTIVTDGCIEQDTQEVYEEVQAEAPQEVILHNSTKETPTRDLKEKVQRR